MGKGTYNEIESNCQEPQTLAIFTIVLVISQV